MIKKKKIKKKDIVKNYFKKKLRFVTVSFQKILTKLNILQIFLNFTKIKIYHLLIFNKIILPKI